MLTGANPNLMSAASMTLFPIFTIPDPVLRKVAAPVERIDDELRRLADDMLATMYDAPGIGLAAPQIGISRRRRLLCTKRVMASAISARTARTASTSTASTGSSVTPPI